MTDRDRFRLLFGPYETPRFEYGDVVFCEARGEVKLVGLTNARIPWPKCRTGKRSRAIVLYADLARAVWQESAQAVGYWWGVGAFTVWQWRKALGVPAVNHGTSRLRRDYAFEPAYVAARKKAHAKAGDPVRCAKIAAARRGKPRPPHVHAAMRAGKVGWRRWPRPSAQAARCRRCTADAACLGCRIEGEIPSESSSCSLVCRRSARLDGRSACVALARATRRAERRSRRRARRAHIRSREASRLWMGRDHTPKGRR